MPCTQQQCDQIAAEIEVSAAEMETAQANVQVWTGLYWLANTVHQAKLMEWMICGCQGSPMAMKFPEPDEKTKQKLEELRQSLKHIVKHLMAEIETEKKQPPDAAT